MMSVICVLLLLFNLTVTVPAAVVPPSLDMSQMDLLKNVTNARKLGAIDPRFTATYRQYQGSLSTVPCIMSAVNAMTELALEDFTEQIPSRTYIDPNYPEIVVEFMSSDDMAEARFVLWGVWEGIKWMINHGRFRELMIGAHWDGILKCDIWIKSTRGQSSIAENSDNTGHAAQPANISTHNAMVESKLGLSSTDDGLSLVDQRVRLEVTHIGKGLGMMEVFIAIFAALEYMAHFPRINKISAFRVSPEEETTEIGILDLSEAPPSLLEYQWAILGMRHIPGYMLQRESFTEVVFRIDVNNVPLGEGYLLK